MSKDIKEEVKDLALWPGQMDRHDGDKVRDTGCKSDRIESWFQNQEIKL